jgi:hypothetical protein
MKNLYFLAAIAAFVLGSCTEEEALDPPAGPEDEASAIGFGTFLDETPQNGIKPLAAIVGIDELRNRNPGFMVKAYTSGTATWDSWGGENKAAPNFMSAQTVTWDSGTWTYSPTKYWPRSNGDWEYVHLFAYSPSTVPFFGVADGNPQLHFTTAEDPDDQTDLIVAAMYNARGDENDGKVTFKFDHVLSRIGFRVENASEAAATISSVKFDYSGIKNAGTYTFSSSTVAGSNKDPGNWSTIGASTFSGTAVTLFTGSATLTTNNEYDISNQNYLMLIPQIIDNTQKPIKLKYTIDGNSEVEGTASLSSSSWEPGKAYIYTLRIGGVAGQGASKMSKVSVVESSGHWGSGTMNNEQ